MIKVDGARVRRAAGSGAVLAAVWALPALAGCGGPAGRPESPTPPPTRPAQTSGGWGGVTGVLPPGTVWTPPSGGLPSSSGPEVACWVRGPAGGEARCATRRPSVGLDAAWAGGRRVAPPSGG